MFMSPQPQYREYTVGPLSVQLTAVYIIILLGVVCQLSAPIAQKMVVSDCHYGNHLQNKICMAQKYSMQSTVCSL